MTISKQVVNRKIEVRASLLAFLHTCSFDNQLEVELFPTIGDYYKEGEELFLDGDNMTIGL